MIVRQHTRDDRQQHQRQGRGDLDHRHHQRAGVGRGDHPGGRHRLRPGAEVGEQVADPDDAEGGDAEGREYAAAGVCRGGGFSFEGKIVLGGNGLEHGYVLGVCFGYRGQIRRAGATRRYASGMAGCARPTTGPSSCRSELCSRMPATPKLREQSGPAPVCWEV
ncbi:hypothetical protein D3C80_1484890 [compost metagenome]